MFAQSGRCCGTIGAMTAEERINDLKRSIANEGYDVSDPSADAHQTVFRVSAHRRDTVSGAGIAAGGKTAVEAYKDLYSRVLERLPPWFVVDDTPEHLVDAPTRGSRSKLARSFVRRQRDFETVDVITAPGVAVATQTRIVEGVKSHGRTLVDELADFPDDLPLTVTVHRDRGEYS